MEFRSGGDLKKQRDEADVFSEKRTKYHPGRHYKLVAAVGFGQICIETGKAIEKEELREEKMTAECNALKKS